MKRDRLPLLCRVVGHAWDIKRAGWIGGCLRVKCTRCLRSGFVVDEWDSTVVRRRLGRRSVEAP